MAEPDPLPRPRITGPRRAGRLSALDPRLAAWRPDLADLALADRIAVPAYVAPVVRSNAGPAVMMRAAPAADSIAVSELLPGEDFAVLEESGGWAWGFSVHDHYVGHVPADALGPALAPTHMAGPGDALVFAAADIKAPVIGTCPAGARLAARPAEGSFAAAAGGFVHTRHLLPPGGDPGLDWVEVALLFLGSPYRWGGRSRAGVDCSGLVQMARQIAGRPTRRDSDMQAEDAAPVARQAARRGDIACWAGHVGILLDGGGADSARLLHATAHAMRTLIEPLATVEARIGPAGIRRLPG